MRDRCGRPRSLYSGRKWASSLCFDATTGAKVAGSDVDGPAWERLIKSRTLRAVYAAPELHMFWAKLFDTDGRQDMKPLVRETFVRLKGSDATYEHAVRVT